MSKSLLNETGWEALANIRLKHLEAVSEENAALRKMLNKLTAERPTKISREELARIKAYHHRYKTEVPRTGDVTIKMWDTLAGMLMDNVDGLLEAAEAGVVLGQ